MTMPQVGKSRSKLKHTYIVGGLQSATKYLGKQPGGFLYKDIHTLTIWPSNSKPRHLYNKNESMFTQKLMHERS